MDIISMKCLITIAILFLFAGCDRPTLESRHNHNVALDTVHTFTIHIGTSDFSNGYSLVYIYKPDSLTITYRNGFGQQDTIIHRQSLTTNYRDSIRSILKGMALDTFQRVYENRGVADGDQIGITISLNDSSEKRIGIANYYLPDLFPLFDLIDSTLPPQYRIRYHESAEIFRKYSENK